MEPCGPGRSRGWACFRKGLKGLKMNSALNAVLIDWAEHGWWWPLRRLVPPRGQRMSWAFPGFAALFVGLVIGIPILLLSRWLYGDWSFWAFWVFGVFGLFAGLIGGSMVLLAWNRDVIRRQRLAAMGQPLPPVGRPSRLLRWTVRPILAAAIVFTALLLTTGVENWRGSRALEKFRADLRARSEPVTLEDVVPPPIPDERNLAMAPLLRPLLDYEHLKAPPSAGESPYQFRDPEALARVTAISVDKSPGISHFMSKHDRSARSWQEGGRTDLEMWQAYYHSQSEWPRTSEPQSAAQDVLTALDRWEPQLSELRRAAADRPEIRFPLHYHEGFLLLANHLGPLKSICGVLRLRAVALLADHRPEEALADVRLGFHLSDGLKDEPLLISELVRIAMDTLLLDPVWEGCLDHRWTETQLAELQALLAQRDYLQEMRNTLRGERVMGDRAFAGMIRGQPDFAGGANGAADTGGQLLVKLMNRGWIEQNRVAYGRYVDALATDLATAGSHAALPSGSKRFETIVGKRSLFTILAALLAPALNSADDKAFEMEARRRVALVGVALERARLAEGGYPAELQALVPRWLPQGVPNDPMNGQPLRYERTAAGDYHLYSVGLDHRNDGGRRPEGRAHSSAERRRPSDIVWR